MRGLTLFRSTLLLPLVVPVIALLLQFDAAGFLGIAMFVAAGPYAVFVFWAWRRIGQYSSFREAYIFLAKAPVIFALPICLVWFLGSLAIAVPFLTALKSTGQISVVFLATAYLYSFIAAVLAVSAQTLGIAGKYK